jgi:hypothetical protein
MKTKAIILFLLFIVAAKTQSFERHSQHHSDACPSGGKDSRKQVLCVTDAPAK